MNKTAAEKNTSACEVLQSLIAGNDPVTGKPIPHDSILNRAGVLRALLAGLEALNSTKARDKRRSALPANVGKAWTKEQETRLIAGYKSGDSVQTIAKRHQRTTRAIAARLEKVGLLKPEDKNTLNSLIDPDSK